MKMIPLRDFTTLQSIDAELFNGYFHELDYLVLDRSHTLVDAIYNDSKSKQFLPAQSLTMWTNRNPRERVLKRYGFDTPRELLLIFSTRILEVQGIFPDIGDRVILDDGLYELTTAAAQARYPNSNQRFHVAAAAEKVRPEGVSPMAPAAQVLAGAEIFKARS